MCASKTCPEIKMSVTTVYQTTCRACESIEAAVMASLAFVADFFTVASVATKHQMPQCLVILMKQNGLSTRFNNTAETQAIHATW